MSNTDYLFATGKIRALENGLLDASVMENLMSTQNVDEAVRILSDHGWPMENAANYDTALKALEKEAFTQFTDAIKDSRYLALATVFNDYHNLKAGLKALVSASDSLTEGFIEPTRLDKAELSEALRDKQFEFLPDDMPKDAAAAYEKLTSTLDGQLCDLLLDRKALEAFIKVSESTGNAWIMEYAQKKAAVADLSVALRASRQRLPEDTVLSALAPCDGIHTEELAKAAAKGTEDALRYLKSTPYEALANAFSESHIKFEKDCDDYLTEHLKKAAFVSFGPEPVVAYYFARLLEIRVVRMILVELQVGVLKDVMKERMRALYV